MDGLTHTKQLLNLLCIVYLTLIHNIPNSWKTNIKNENINTPKQTTILSQLIKNKHTNKYAYTLLQKMKIRPDKKSETKWTEQFNYENINWKTIYTTSLKATKDIKLQNFNYKFLMRIIPTNKFLLKCNIGHTALCEFCSMEIETLNHLFWECIHVQHFWTNLSVFLQEISILTGIQYINSIQLKKCYAGYYGRNKFNRNPN